MRDEQLLVSHDGLELREIEKHTLVLGTMGMLMAG